MTPSFGLPVPDPAPLSETELAELEQWLTKPPCTGDTRDSCMGCSACRPFDHLELSRLIATVRAFQQQRQQWQPIETAPMDRLIIGAFITDGRVWRVHEMKHNGLAFYTRSGGSLPKMTHWIEMPALQELLDAD